MRLSIVLLAVFTVSFGLLDCINARSSAASLKNDQTGKPNFFFVKSKDVSTIQHFTNERIISSIKIKNRPQHNFKNYDSVDSMTYNCANNYIYMLKHNALNDNKKILDVIHFNNHNKFRRMKQVKDMFDNATSIASDYITGKIYWTAVNNDGNYSIKVTDKSFKKVDYVVLPNKVPMRKIQVYPKRSEIFYSAGNHIWYTSNLPNSTQNFLVAANELIDFTIDYATDNLCWREWPFDPMYIEFYCVNIATSPRPVEKPTSIFGGRPAPISENLAAFNGTLYWFENMGPNITLKARSINEMPVYLATFKHDRVESFVASICPSNVTAASVA